jgi:hypothetical protein
VAHPVDLPWSTECEGPGPGLIRWYNRVVYLGGVAAIVAWGTENRAAPR